MPEISREGISLLHCFQNLPGMREFLPAFGVHPLSVRAKFSFSDNEASNTKSFSLIFHSQDDNLLQSVYEKVLLLPELVNRTEIQELYSGCVINITSSAGEAVGFHFPNGFQQECDEILFCCENDELNEFGVFYGALFILGSYARYYPDQWMVDVESSSPLALAATEFLTLAEHRVPLLTLSEFTRTWHLSS